MKNFKLFVTATSLASMFVITSCRKDYTCTCSADLDEDGSIHPIEETLSYPLMNLKKGEVESACQVAGSTWYAAGGSCTYKAN